MKKIYSEPGRSLTAETELVSLIFHLPEMMVQYFGLCTSKCQESFEAEFSNDKKLGLNSNLYIDVYVHYYILNINWRCITAAKDTESDTVYGCSAFLYSYYLHVSTATIISSIYPPLLLSCYITQQTFGFF